MFIFILDQCCQLAQAASQSLCREASHKKNSTLPPSSSNITSNLDLDRYGPDLSNLLDRSGSDLGRLLNHQSPPSSQNLVSTQNNRQPHRTSLPSSTYTQTQSAQADRGVHAVLTSPQIEEYVSILKNHKLSIQRQKDAEAQQEKMVEVNVWVKVCQHL